MIAFRYHLFLYTPHVGNLDFWFFCYLTVRFPQIRKGLWKLFCQRQNGILEKGSCGFRGNAVDLVADGNRDALLALFHAKLRLHFNFIVKSSCFNHLLKTLDYII